MNRESKCQPDSDNVFYQQQILWNIVPETTNDLAEWNHE